MSVKFTPRVLIPAAGFGKRVGAPESKEMLPHPLTRQPLIEESLNLARERGWNALVITRPEKQNLIHYLQNRPNVDTLLIEPTREWPETILIARGSWSQHNILVLPDTEFYPHSAIDDVATSLKNGHSLVSAVFEVADPSVWGMVRRAQDQLEFCEKPMTSVSGALAWGLIGFHADVGEELFTQLLDSTRDHQWKNVGAQGDFVKLTEFRDLTRR